MCLQIGKTYIHNQTKGLYRVLALGKSTTNGQERVLYRSLFDGSKWDRSVEAFTENVPEKGPRFSQINLEGKQIQRMKEQWTPRYEGVLKSYSMDADLFIQTQTFMCSNIYGSGLENYYVVGVCRNVEDLSETIYYKNKEGEIFVQAVDRLGDYIHLL